MTGKIFRSIFLVSALVLVASILIIMGVSYSYFSDVQSNSLAVELSLATEGVEKNGGDYLSGLKSNEYRLTLIEPDGTVTYDSVANPAEMENHSGREEVKEALNDGEGASERLSPTLTERTIYRAKRLSNGEILRISVTQYTVFTLLMGMLYPMIIVLVVAVILSVLIAYRISKHIVKPLNELDLDHPLENESYDELSPLLRRIAKQNEKIDEQVYELKRKSEEFSTVIDKMNEALILINSGGRVLSINSAAEKLLGTGSDCIGRDFVTVDRTPKVQETVKKALGGEHSETVVSKNERSYQIIANPVAASGKVFGAAVMGFDITEKEFAERQRREFSANVSHELKTPLQSIMGSAELLENGLVKPEDTARFVGHIRSEAGRLVTLINDIMRLSQLDENVDLPVERFTLESVANEVLPALADAAEKKDVTVNLNGTSPEICGVRRLVYELIYNLCDNAVKYNKNGGRVNITVRKAENESVISVADTGIGIPEEECERIFERFYRIDKSHSKTIGGTGLGLSIVKHAAALHHAKVTVTGNPDGGTTFTVAFPCK